MILFDWALVRQLHFLSNVLFAEDNASYTDATNASSGEGP